MVLHVALVQPERKLVHVPLKMLLAEGVVHTIEAALQHGPHALDAISMRHAIHVLLGAVVDRSMVIHQVHADVGAVLVGIEGRSRNHRVDNGGLNRSCIGAGKHFAPDLTPAFAHSQDSDLTDGAAPGIQLLVLMLVGFLAADVGLIGFHDALKEPVLIVVILLPASLPDTLQEEPSRFLGDPDLLRQLE